MADDEAEGGGGRGLARESCRGYPVVGYTSF